MIDDSEEDLIRTGVRSAIKTLFGGLHSEDDHGFDLAKWLQSKEDEIVKLASNKVAIGRAMLID